MTMKNSLFLLISKVLGKGCGARRGPTNNDEGISVSADFKCFRKQVWGLGWGPLMRVNDSLFLLTSNVLGRGPTNDGEGFIVSADFKCLRKGAHQ